MKKFIKKIIQEKKTRGFTILETLVAIFILVLSVTGPMVFAQSGLRTAFLARDQITAFFLAQDAIETIKNIRDDNALDSNINDWLSGIMICNQNINNECVVRIDTTRNPPVLKECVSGTCNEPLQIDDSTGFFGYDFSSQSTNSRFVRNVHLIESISERELQIVVEVSWTSNVRVGGSRIVVQENIYNWVPRVDQN